MNSKVPNHENTNASEGDALGFSGISDFDGPGCIIVYLRFFGLLEEPKEVERLERFISAVIRAEVLRGNLELSFQHGLIEDSLRAILEEAGPELTQALRNRAETALLARLTDYNF